MKHLLSLLFHQFGLFVTGLITHSITVGYKAPEGTVTSITTSYSADEDINLSDTVLAGATNKEFDVAVTIANIKSMVLWSDKNLTIKTNSSSTPQETITLTANVQKVYTFDGAAPNFFSGNITKFFCTNAGIADAKLVFRALVNQGV